MGEPAPREVEVWSGGAGAAPDFSSSSILFCSPKQADNLKVGRNVLARLLRGDELQLVEGAAKEGGR